MRKITFFFAYLTLVISCQAETIIVDANGFADFNNIQDAVDSAAHYDIVEVQEGIYREFVNFYGKAITVTSTNPEDANVVRATVIDGNSFEKVVVFDCGEDSNSVLTGLTVQGGQYGVFCYDSGPVVSNCVIKSNYHGIYGNNSSPAPYIYDNLVTENQYGISSVRGIISKCRVIGNSQVGIWFCEYASIENCTISNNYTGIYDHHNVIKNCLISGNKGHGLQGFRGSSGAFNCIIVGNGGHGLDRCEGDFINCTIVGNKGGGFYLNESYYAALLKNNIITKNWGYGVEKGKGSIALSYNNIWGNLAGSYYGVQPGTTDMHSNPLFALEGYWDDPCGTPSIPDDDVWVDGDYHLKSAAGRWDPNSETWVMDDANSPCIDAGDPCDPIGYEPNPNGARINMGAYGGTTKASKSYIGSGPEPPPYCTEYPAMDFNKDCKVNFKDFALFTQSWLECNLDPPEACWE